MKKALEPSAIYRKIVENKIKIEEGIENLLLIVEKSDDHRTRLESLQIFNCLTTQDQKIFKTLENCLISDESDEIRTTSAKIIIEHYIDSGIECLEWAILNEVSPKLLKVLGDKLESSKTHQTKTLYRTYLQRLENLANELGISSLEVPFLLDIEFNLKDYRSLNLNGTNRLIFTREVMFLIQDQRITELSISLRDKIPSSIKVLKKLKNLNLSCNNLTELPDALTELTNLESLDLSWNDFIEIPAVLNKLKSIENINFQGNFVKY